MWEGGGGWGRGGQGAGTGQEDGCRSLGSRHRAPPPRALGLRGVPDLTPAVVAPCMPRFRRARQGGGAALDRAAVPRADRHCDDMCVCASACCCCRVHARRWRTTRGRASRYGDGTRRSACAALTARSAFVREGDDGGSSMMATKREHLQSGTGGKADTETGWIVRRGGGQGEASTTGVTFPSAAPNISRACLAHAVGRLTCVHPPPPSPRCVARRRARGGGGGGSRARRVGRTTRSLSETPCTEGGVRPSSVRAHRHTPPSRRESRRRRSPLPSSPQPHVSRGLLEMTLGGDPRPGAPMPLA